MRSLFFPVLISVLFPVVVQFAINREPGLPAERISSVLDSFSIFLVIGAAFVPLGIASYSIVGEKN